MNNRVAHAMLRELMEIKLARLRPDIITSTLAAEAANRTPGMLAAVKKPARFKPRLEDYAHITDRPARAASMPTHLTGSRGAHPAVGGGGGATLVP